MGSADEFLNLFEEAPERASGDRFREIERKLKELEENSERLLRFANATRESIDSLDRILSSHVGPGAGNNEALQYSYPHPGALFTTRAVQGPFRLQLSPSSSASLYLTFDAYDIQLHQVFITMRPVRARSSLSPSTGFQIPSGSNHYHDLSWGVYDGPAIGSPAINLLINSANVTTALGGPWNSATRVDATMYFRTSDLTPIRQDNELTFSVSTVCDLIVTVQYIVSCVGPLAIGTA